MYQVTERTFAENQAEAFSVSIAVGLAIRKEGESGAQLLQRADIRMYEEKQRMKVEKLT